jgi:predicted nucleic acid-binding protein
MDETRARLVVDCSVTFKWKVASEEFSDEARELLKDMDAKAVDCIAPDILPAEIASAFLRAVRRGRLTFSEAIEAVRELVATPIRLYPSSALLERALQIAHTYQQGLFDCLYVALAEREGVELWTGDERLVNALSPHFPFIRFIGEYKPKRV